MKTMFDITATQSGVLLALLVSGHVLADFLFQPQALVEKKNHGWWLAVHALVVTLTQAAVVLPLVSTRALPLLLAIGVSHAAIDAAKIRLERQRRNKLTTFTLDQAAHIAVVGVVWLAWLRIGPETLRFLPPTSKVASFARVAVIAAAYALNITGGATVVAALLERYNLPATSGAGAATTDEASRGRVIGVLERILVLTLVLLQEWGAIGLVVAAKSIARFKDLEDRSFCEYYLIGTLASMLMATLTGILVSALI
jgi:hypothetical protein